ncbi:phasin family protein [Vibrio sp. HN007]|uniref:phasin family protein n=1 Tax=Vibrio iocasae TaxID=3098914 RepID=UPI0035D40BE7
MGIFSRSAASDDKSVESMRETMMYNIWLAGLGAYAKSAEEVNGISSRGRSLFEDLLERGRAIEKQQKERVYTKRSQATVAMEERLHQMVQKVTGVESFKLNEVDDKLDKLTEQVELLLKQSQAQKESAPAATAAAESVAKEVPAKPAAKTTKAAPRSNSGIARRKAPASKAKTETATKAPARKPKTVTTEKAE